MKFLTLFYCLFSFVNSETIQFCKQNTKNILLTFDDGPDIITENIVDTLDKYNIKGLFFHNGIKVLRNNADILMHKIYNNGHTIGTHTYSHAALIGLNDFNIRRELLDNEFYLFRRLFNNRPLYIRPPYFSYDDRVENFFNEFGYINIVASFESTDWFEPEDSNRVLNTCKEQIDNGINDMIVLLHENILTNADILEQFIIYALEKNYTFTDINTCVNNPEKYNIDNTYGPNLENGGII